MNDRYRYDYDNQYGSITFGEERGGRQRQRRRPQQRSGGQEREREYADRDYSGEDYRPDRYGAYSEGRYGWPDEAYRQQYSTNEPENWRGFDPWRPSAREEQLGWQQSGQNSPRASNRAYGGNREIDSRGNSPSDWWPSARREGGFYGKGPKGYTRSDERIRDDISDRLTDDDEVDASDITVTVKDGEVTLQGSVPDRRSKHRAEDIVDAVSGVKDIHNQLKPRKAFLSEVGDRLTGRDEVEQRGHTGEGPRSGAGGGGGPAAARHR